MSFYLYYHNGSDNHGCEAIIRSTVRILNNKLVLASQNPKCDKKYYVDKIVNIINDSECRLSLFNRLIISIYCKFSNSDYLYILKKHKEFFRRIKKGDVCFSIGGDNYCYKGQDILGYYNYYLHRKGAKTVLWGCSVEPDIIKGDVAKDLSRYDAIVARESISYEALKKVNSNTYLCCDPAFNLEVADVELPDGFIDDNTVGINVSPLIISCESKEGVTLGNYVNLIDYIIDNTDMNIALIPHVVCEGNDDREVLRKLYNNINDKSRVIIIDDFTAPELKGYISHCRFFVGARTHATIAAYSTYVPTLVVGYSVKSKGIAKDIFGTHENYVVSVQDLIDGSTLVDAFKWLQKEETKIKLHLNSFITGYKKSIYNVKEELWTIL